MSSKTVLLAVLVMLVLGAATLVVLNRPGGLGAASGVVPVNEPLASFDPERVTGLLIIAPTAAGSPATAPAPAEVIRRQGAAWTLELATVAPAAPGDAGAAASLDAARLQRVAGPWPLDPSRVSTVLRTLAAARASGTPGAGSAIGEGAHSVEVFSEDARSNVTLRFAARTLGGQGLVEVTAAPVIESGQPVDAPPRIGPRTTRLAMVSDGLHTLLAVGAARGWRDPTLLPGLTARAQRITLSGGGSAGAGQRVTLQRAQGRWIMREPVEAPTDALAVQSLLGALDALRIARFFDEQTPAPAVTGFDTPVARVAFETQERQSAGGDATRAVGRVELLIGKGLDAGLTQLYATVDGGASVVAVDSASLRAISILPARYLSATATAVPSADVSVLLYRAGTDAPASAGGAAAAGDLGFRRTLAGWVELRPDGQEVLQDERRAGQINEALTFLTSTPSRAISLDTPEGYRAAGRISLRDPEGDALEDLEVGVATAGQIVVKTGSVYRTFPAAPSLFKPAADAARPPAPEEGEGPGKRDITK